MIEINNEEVQVIQGVVPSKSNCYRIITLGNHASLAKTPALKKYEESFTWQCGKYRNANIDTTFEFLRWHFTLFNYKQIVIVT